MAIFVIMKITILGYTISISKKTDWFIKPEHEVQLSFTHNGIEYYSFVNQLNLYAKRYFAALDAIAVMDAGIDKKFINIFFKTAQEYINKQQWAQLMGLINNLYQRSTYVTNDELFLTICAVIFFDKSENPYDFNTEYAEIKKARWRKDSEVLGKLWERVPPSFLPSLDTSKMSIQNYLTAQGIEEASMLEKHLENLSLIGGNKELMNIIKSRLQELY
jgi:hypothetical protein